VSTGRPRGVDANDRVQEYLVRDAAVIDEIEHIWKQGELGARLADATEAQRAVIERKMRDLDARMAVLDSIMRTFDPPMRELDRDIHELEKKEEAAEKQAEAATDATLARAIASGVAKPFP